MRKWIARFSYTFLILGGLLFYEAYKLQTSDPRPPAWQLVMIVAGGALALALGSQGIRIRHEQIRED